MGAISDTAADTFRDQEVPGVGSAGEHDPAKSDIRAWAVLVDTVIASIAAGIAVGNAVAFATAAAMNADLVHAANVLAFVYADSTAANNGVYIKVGGSGTGSWSLTSVSLPSNFSTQIAAAATSAAAAAASATTSMTGATTATSEAAIATAQAGIATTQAGLATTQATAAAASATSVAGAVSSATAQATAAGASATAAAASATTATAQAVIATTQAGIATTQATAAATHDASAATSASNAGASAAGAAASATTATTEAGIATTQAGIASAAAATVSGAAGYAATCTSAAATASSAATTATTQAGIATAGGATATTQAGIATTEAGIATSAAATAVTAAGSATSSAATATAAATAASAAADASGPATFFDTYALATAGLSGIANLGIVEIFADETLNGARTRYRKESGAYVFKVNLSDIAGQQYMGEVSGAPARSAARILDERIDISKGGLSDAQMSDIRTGLSTVDIGPVLCAIIADLSNTVGANASLGPYRGAPKIHVPSGRVFSSTAWEPHGTFHLEGEGGGITGGIATEFHCAGVKGPEFNRYNTTNGSVISPTSYGCDGSMIEDIGFTYSGAATTTIHGLQVRANSVGLRNVTIGRGGAFPGKSLYVEASSLGADQGNANGYDFQRVSIFAGQYGFWEEGTDVNAGYTKSLQISGASAGGMICKGFLGSTHIASQVAACGTASSNFCTYGGHNWQCLNDLLAGTEVPGTGGSWFDLGAGSGYTAWTMSSTGWTIGCPVFANNPNARALFLGTYIELSQPRSHVLTPSQVLFANAGSRFTTLNGNCPGSNFTVSANGNYGFAANSLGTGSIQYDTAGNEVQWNSVGDQGGNGTMLRTGRTDQANHECVRAWQGGDIAWLWDNYNGWKFMIEMGVTTALDGGRGVAQQGQVMFPRGLFLGDDAGTQRMLMGGTGAPVNGKAARGERVLLSGGSAGGFAEKYCVTGGDNATPTSVWKDCASIAA